MTTTARITYWDTRSLADDNGIAPAQCKRCGLTRSYGLSWTIGQDDGTDPQYVGYQCRHCGNTQGLSRSAILRRVKHAREQY